MPTRRVFLASVAAAAGSAGGTRLKGQPGSPGRRRPSTDFYGPQFYDDKEKQQVVEVIETGRPFRWYGPGDEPPVKVLTFEKEFGARMQCRYCLGVTSGTAALQTAMAALEIGPGDEVILPAWTWHSCYTAIVLAGGLPVFAEIDESFNIDPKDIEKHVTPHTRAIIAVHLQGNPADMDPILAIARKHRLRVLEDCAQSVGGSYKGRPLGSLGDIAIYSLQLNKTISAGEGGAVTTNDPVLFERACRFHDVGGMRGPHEKLVGKPRLQPFVGCNFRMSEFTGGVLLAQTRKLDIIVGGLRAAAGRVYAGISDLPGIKLRYRPDPAGELGVAVFAGFSGKEQRDEYMAALKKEGVSSAPPVGSVILPIQPYIEKKATVHPAWPSFTSERGRQIQYGAGCCPKTIDILNRFAGVPLGPKFNKEDTDEVVAAIRKVYPSIVRAT